MHGLFLREVAAIFSASKKQFNNRGMAPQGNTQDHHHDIQYS
jgi:hypothetical protein